MIYGWFERLWHWLQALFIIILMVTGFETHSSYTLFGYETAVRIHEITARAFILLIALAIFWHITTGEWRQYQPKGERSMVRQGRYYAFGIFKGEDHPYRKSEVQKLNPMQKATYLGFKILIVPVMVFTGLIYMYYDWWASVVPTVSLTILAAVHTVGAFALVIFLIVHVYMTTTGEKPMTNITAMVTGYEEIEEESEVEPASV
jgi:thiosulfate reductase cytochrome b subunit